MRRLRHIPLLFAALAAGLLVAGCGGDDGGEDVGPAAAVPASAPIYVEFAVQPEGAAKEGAEQAASKILDTPDPGGKILSLLEQSAADEGTPVNFAEDVQPWLGEDAAVFLTTFSEDDDGTFVIESTDTGAAIDFLSKQSDATGRKGEYEGNEYEFDTDGDVFGAVGDFIVAGSEDGFKQAVDAESGDSLGDSDGFKDSRDDLSDETIANFYAEPKTILGAIPEDDLDASARDTVEKSLGDAADQPIVGDLTASAEGIAFELSAGNNGVETSESTLLESVPAGAWLGIGLADIGDAVTQGIEQTKEAEVPGFNLDAISSQLSLATGHDLEEITASLGEGAIFVQGTSVPQLSGAVVIQSKDPAVTGDLVNKLGTLISQGADPRSLRVQPLASTGGDQGFRIVDRTGELPQPVDVIQRGDKLVIGYGPGAADQALAAGQTLSTVPAFTDAQGQLSDLGLDMFLSLPQVFQLAESEGAAADPDYQAAKPYIDALGWVAEGSGTEGDRALLKFVLGLN